MANDLIWIILIELFLILFEVEHKPWFSIILLLLRDLIFEGDWFLLCDIEIV